MESSIADAELREHGVDPRDRAFELRPGADWRFVEHEMPAALTARPLGAVFFVDKRRLVAELVKDFRGGGAVVDVGLGFDAGFVARFGVRVVGGALVGQHAALAVGAQAQQLAARPQAAIGRVVERVALKRPVGCKLKITSFDRPAEGPGIGDSELQFDLGALHGLSVPPLCAETPLQEANIMEIVPPTLRLDAGSLHDVSEAAALLRAGGTVAFPTETVYGLGAKALDKGAVAKIFHAKQRPSWDPLIVHIAAFDQLPSVASVPEDLRRRVGDLAAAFWPGPLTLLLPRTSAVPDAVTAGRALVGVRVPAHPAALALLRAAGLPVAAPSANRFGHTSPTTAAHVLADLEGRIDAVLDGGPTQVGVESTVLDPKAMMVYRPGAVTMAQIAAVCGLAPTLFEPGPTAALPESLPSPGVGLRHYAPRATLLLVEPPALVPGRCLLETAETLQASGRNVGIMLPDGWAAPAAVKIFPWGGWTRQNDLAAALFAGLRALDEAGVEVILCPVPPGPGLAAAMRDRLEKAARLS